MGIPTIATRVGGFPDVIEDGKTGWLVPPKAPERLSSSIIEAISDPLMAFNRAQRGQALVRKLFNVKTTAMQILSIYKNIVLRKNNLV